MARYNPGVASAGEETPKRRWSLWKLLLGGLAVLLVVVVVVARWALGPAFHHALPGVIAETSGDYDDAIHHYRKVYEGKPDAFMVAHDIACCYARKGDSEQAMLWLRRAFETDYGDYARKWARTEEDFDSVRDSEEFRALLETPK